MSKTILSLLAFSGVCQGKLTVKYVGQEQLTAEDQFEQFKFKFNKVYESGETAALIKPTSKLLWLVSRAVMRIEDLEVRTRPLESLNSVI